MRFTCNREQLWAAFQTAATVVPSRSPKAILKNIRIDVVPGCATVMATDLEIGIRLEVSDVDVEAAGSVLVPVQLFGPILRESSDQRLSVESSESGTVVKGDRSRFKLPYQNPDEYPVVASFNETSFHSVSAPLFRELIRRTVLATDTENSRYALGGVLLELDTEAITGVATDGRRLAVMTGVAQAVEGHNTADMMTIVPTRAMQLLERAVADADAEVQIVARTNDLLVKTSRATVYARLVEGRFPRWRDVMPERIDSSRIDLVVGPLLSALRQAAIFSSAESRGINFTFSEGNLVLSAATAEAGESQVELPISYTGNKIILAMDNRYVMDFLRVLDPSRTVTIDIENSDSAAVFNTDDGYRYVVMPMARDDN